MALQSGLSKTQSAHLLSKWPVDLKFLSIANAWSFNFFDLDTLKLILGYFSSFILTPPIFDINIYLEPEFPVVQLHKALL